MRVDKLTKGTRAALTQLHKKLSRSYSKSLFLQLQSMSSLKPGLSPALFVAYLLATLVYVLMLWVGILGTQYLVSGWSTINPISVFFGVALLFLVFSLRPQFARVVNKPVDPDAFPVLYSLVEKVRLNLRAPKIHGIWISPTFTAALVPIGIQQKSYLEFGLPLLDNLTSEEIIALVAHEIAHSVNKDPNKNRYILPAMTSLYGVNSLFNFPADILAAGCLGLVMLPIFIVYWIISALAFIFLFILINLFWFSSQKAEYYANLMACEVAGTEAVIGLLKKTRFSNVLENAVSRVAMARSSDVFEELKKEVGYRAALPEVTEGIDFDTLDDEKEIFTTHPPLKYALAFIQKQPNKTPKVMLTIQEIEDLKNELAVLKPPIHEWLMAHSN